MAVNKNFVVKNGIEVATDVIVASSETKNVGVGTTVGQVLLDVRGAIGATDLSVSGVGTIVTLNSTNFTGTAGTIVTLNSTNFTGTAGTIGNVQISSGIVTASSGIVTYYGDGQFLSNVISGIGIRTEGSIVGYGVTLIEFRGAGISTITTDSTTGIGTINITGGGGGGASISIGTVFSGVATSGNLWYKSDLGRLFIYYQDADSAQWVDASPFNIGIITSLTNVSYNAGSAISPSIYFNGDPQTGFFSPTSGQFTVVSTGSSVLNINPGGINVTGVATASSFVGNLTGNADTASTAETATYASTAGIATYATTAGVATALLGGNAGVNTTSTPTNLYVYGNAASNVVGLGTTDANTTLDFSQGNNFSLTLTGNIVLSNPTGVTTGQSGIIEILQDGTGSRTCGFGSHWDFPSATPPTLSTGANALDALTYFVRSSTSIIANSIIGIGTL